MFCVRRCYHGNCWPLRYTMNRSFGKEEKNVMNNCYIGHSFRVFHGVFLCVHRVMNISFFMQFHWGGKMLAHKYLHIKFIAVWMVESVPIVATLFVVVATTRLLHFDYIVSFSLNITTLLCKCNNNNIKYMHNCILCAHVQYNTDSIHISKRFHSIRLI